MQVFISYSHQDRVFVDELASRLKKEGIEVWYDPQLKPGRAWSKELQARIRGCDALLVIVTPASNKSDYVDKEIHAAESAGKPIIPILLKRAKLPLSLANLEYIDASDSRDPLPGILAALAGEIRPPTPPPQKQQRRVKQRPAESREELVIRFAKSSDDAPIPFSVALPAPGLDPIDDTFVSPLDDKILADIRWYLELYPQWPSGPDYDRAQRVEKNLVAWGEELFNALFKQSKARDIYRQFERAAGEGRVLTIQANDPRVLQLPWELLAEEGGFLFTQNPPISIRRRLPKYLAQKESPKFDLPIRVLMVVSRPDDKDVSFLDPRSSAQALLDAVDVLGDTVVVEFLRPPTLAALDRALREKTFHIVHFDGHGVYDRVKGLGMLLFERADHSLDMVGADQIGTLLNQRNIPLVILDACQTAMQKTEFSSVAAKLMEAGIGSVIAMNYSVLVPTTRKFVEAFYRDLAAGRSVAEATEGARRALLGDKHRLDIYRGGKNEPLDLNDWFLPALYQQSQDPVLFSTAKDAKRAKKKHGEVPVEPERGGFPKPPSHGFHGRARELLELERLMLPRPDAEGKPKPGHRIVVLHGWGGQGKTALATEAAHWFARTGLFQRAVFVSFERGGGLELALGEMGNALVSENFAIHGGDPVAAIENALKEKPTLIVWDNFETLLEGGNTPLDAKALQELLNAGLSWARAGESRLLITTRDPGIPHEDYEPSQTTARHELTGLAAFDALALAGSILDDNGIEPPSREELLRLLDFLGGHPLSLHLVIPQLHDYTPSQLIREFDKLLPNFSQGAAKTKDESLRVSLEFSLNRLDAETRARLPQLAIFQGGAFEPIIWNITDFTEEEWARVRTQLARAALIRIENLPGVKSPYIHFHPTLAPYLATLLSHFKEEGQGEGQQSEKYRSAYYALADQLYHADNQNPTQARSIVVREMANLRRALDLMLGAGEMDSAIDFADSIARFLDNFGRWRERDEVMNLVASRKSSADSSGKLTRAGFLLESRRGETLRSQGKAAEAESVFRSLLERIDAGVEYDAGYDRVLVLERIGRSLELQGKPNAAADHYRVGIASAEKLEQSDDVKRTIGVFHSDLADVLTDQGHYSEARKEYEAALEIDKVLGDERAVAAVEGQLGTLLQMQGNLKEAQKRHLSALETFHQLGEDRMEATAWHQLGMVAQEAREWDEAEKCYKESLKLKERLSDDPGVARTCNQLAIVAKNAGRLEDAERWYRRAITIGEEIGDQLGIAKRANNLAAFLLEQWRLDEAEGYAQRAREIKETLDLSSEPWTTYDILAEIAEKRQRTEEARDWRRKERESFAAFPGSEQQIARWRPVIAAVVVAARGNQEARQQVEELCTKLAETKDWKNLSAAIRRILAGERDHDALADSLNLDREDALVVRRILEGIAKKNE